MQYSSMICSNLTMVSPPMTTLVSLRMLITTDDEGSSIESHKSF